MARIPLRTYDREIENLIDRGQIEEAIAHAKNILKQYPKHIETYRLLGKAFLESQRYSEASDILQRVLSVIPDDFVSQLGISIIREDEGNLDAAIWHMERAFEVQPFNRAVQDELRRLYGRRDGLEPPRVRLTRGSLVRMYAKGELFPQAIAETRAALAEDPQRVDLQVLLARMYYLTGQKVEAAEIASSLIGKMPYCMEANRILMDILPSTSRAEDARVFQRRVYDLDPYAEFVSPNAPASAQVPDQSVMVERVDWTPSSQDNQAPDWTRTIGVKWDENKEEEALPDWLNAVGGTPDSAVSAPEREETPPDDIVPDFMRNAGWTPSSQENVATPPDDAVADEGAENLVSAEIPDWLQSMAPQSQTAETGEEPAAGWLDDILPAAGGALAGAAGLAAAQDESPQTQPADSIDWLGGVTQSVPDLLQQANEEEIPSWMTELGSNEPAVPAFEENRPALPPTEDELPAWLRAESESAVTPTLPAAGDAPADQSAGADPLRWSADAVQPEETASDGDIPSWANVETPAHEPNEALPDWLTSQDETPFQAAPGMTEENGESLLSSPDETEAEEEREYSIPGWRQEISIETTGLAETTPPPIDEETEELPDWLAALGQLEETGEHDQTTLDSVSEEGTRTEPAVVEPLAEPLVTEAEFVSQVPVAETELPASEPDLSDMDAALAWLEGLAAKQGADEESLKISAPDERSETPPDWITGLAAAGVAATALSPGEENQANLKDEPIDLESEEIPEWLRGDDAVSIENELEIPSGEEASPTHETAPAAAESFDLPEWLTAKEPISSEVEAPVPAINENLLDLVSEPPASETEELPDWLRGEETRTAEVEPAAYLEDTTMEALPAEELPDWLKTPEAKSEETGAAQMPEWFSQERSEQVEGMEETGILAEAEGAPHSTQPDLNDMDSAMAWLEGLSAQPGAQEETLPISEPEDRGETVPDWISSLPEEKDNRSVEKERSLEDTQPIRVKPDVESERTEPVTISPEPAAEEPGELPDWLAGLEEESSAAATTVLEPEPELGTMTEDTLDETATPSERLEVPIMEEPVTSAEAEPTAAAPTDADLTDIDAAMAWLESLAEKQGAEEGSLKITAPEMRSETLPDWIAALSEKEPPAEPATIAAATPAVESVEEMPEVEIQVDLPVEEPQFESESTAPTPSLDTSAPDETAADTEIPDWLLNYEEEQQVKTQTWQAPVETADQAAAPPAIADESVTLWLQRHHPEPGAVPVEETALEEPQETGAPSAIAEETFAEAIPGTALAEAQSALERGDIDEAVDHYSQLVQSGEHIDESITDLREALNQHPVDVGIWQALGDAYIRADRIQEALDAYTKAEELLR